MSVTGLSVLEAVFSCGVCFTSYSDIYRDDDSPADTLDDPGLSLRGTVPRLWMTSCGHVICGKHLEGGVDIADGWGYKGAPFHPMGVDMMTVCTICDRDFGEKGDVALYPIWGVTDGFYDSRLPKAFFQVPPIKFDNIYIESFRQGREPSRQEREANEHAREALRFQFISLTCYAKGIRGKLSETESQLRKYEHQLKALKEENIQLLRSLHCQREEYREKLEVLEKEKSAWQQKKRMAIHYVSLVGAIADENATLKQRLVSLGFPMEDTHYTFDDSEIQFISTSYASLGATMLYNTNGGDTTISRGRGKEREELVSKDAHASHLNEDIRTFSDPKKRKYLSLGDDISSKSISMEDLRTIRRQLSRDGMPPPPLPHGGSHGQTAPQVRRGSSLGLPVHVPVVPASRAPTGQGVAVSSRLTDWPFTGPDQIDATRGQTGTSAFFSKPHTNRVYRPGSMEWEGNGPEFLDVLSQRKTVHASSGNLNGTSTSSRPRSSWTIKDPPVGLQTRITIHGRPRTQNGHNGPQRLTKESLATLKEQLRRTTPNTHHRNGQHITSVPKSIPSLNLDYSGSVEGGGILTGVSASKPTTQSPVRNLCSQKNDIERVHESPLLDRRSSYNRRNSSVSDATAYEIPASKRGPPSNEASSIPRNAVNLIPVSPKESPGAINPIPVVRKPSSHRPLSGLSTAPTWLRGLSKIGSGASTQRPAIQTTSNSQSYAPGWYSTQDQRNLVNTPTLQEQARLSIGTARGLMSRSSRWIVKKSTQSIRSLASRGPSVSSPFFKRDNIGTPRRPSPTMEESDSYEVYQRFRTNDRPRTHTSQRNTAGGRSNADREASAMRSAAIREDIFGSSTPESFARATPSLRRPFTPHYVSPSISISGTSLGGSRMVPSSGSHVVGY
ncbi:MAG: hypothetical protein M1840_006113 [Geoglossum simile]|nr:MAG: hypothetical protein M1840_006113 [Geoglossum simile]